MLITYCFKTIDLLLKGSNPSLNMLISVICNIKKNMYESMHMRVNGLFSQPSKGVFHNRKKRFFHNQEKRFFKHQFSFKFE